jgi:hypothetical protein
LICRYYRAHWTRSSASDSGERGFKIPCVVAISRRLMSRSIERWTEDVLLTYDDVPVRSAQRGDDVDRDSVDEGGWCSF